MGVSLDGPSRPLMRYYGGKWRIAPAIVALFPEHQVYTEVYAGGASVLLRKPRVPCEVYNDVEGEVVNVFRVLRDEPERLAELMELTPYARDEYVAAYELSEDPVEAARRFIFRSTAGIGTESSWKKTGLRTSLADCTHCTALSWARLPGHVKDLAARMRGVIIENRDALAVMAQYDAPHSLHYVDPPYLEGTRRSPSKGYRNEMRSPAEHVKLLQFLLTLTGRVALSGYDSELYREFLNDWRAVKIPGARDQSNARREEVLWMNYDPEERELL